MPPPTTDETKYPPMALINTFKSELNPYDGKKSR
jgi:hypothetical protein